MKRLLAVLMALCCCVALMGCAVQFAGFDDLGGLFSGADSGKEQGVAQMPFLPTDDGTESNDIEVTEGNTEEVDPEAGARACFVSYNRFINLGFCCIFEDSDKNLESQLPAELQGAGSGMWHRSACCPDLESAVAHTYACIEESVVKQTFPDYPRGMMAIADGEGFYVDGGAVGMVQYDLSSVQVVSFDGSTLIATCSELNSGGVPCAVVTLTAEIRDGAYVIVAVEEVFI